MSYKDIEPQDAVIKAVCHYYGLDEETFLGPSKRKQYAHPRQVAMLIMRRCCNMKLKQVAYYLNRKDWTTIMHGISAVDGRKIDTGEREDMLMILANLRGEQNYTRQKLIDDFKIVCTAKGKDK